MKTKQLRKIVTELLKERGPMSTHQLVSAYAERRKWGTTHQALCTTLAQYPEFNCVGPKGLGVWYLVDPTEDEDSSIVTEKEQEPFNPFEVELRERNPRMFSLDEHKDGKPFDIIDGKTYYDMDLAWNTAKYGIVNWRAYTNMKVKMHAYAYGFDEDAKDPEIGEPYKSYIEKMKVLNGKLTFMDGFVEEGKMTLAERNKERDGDFVKNVIPFLDATGFYPREYLPDEVIKIRSIAEELLGTNRWTSAEVTTRKDWITKKLANPLEWVLEKEEKGELP